MLDANACPVLVELRCIFVADIQTQLRSTLGICHGEMTSQANTVSATFAE